MKPGHVTRWLSARAEAGDAPETVLTRFGHLRAFYRWCEREEIVAKSPLANLHEPTAETQPVPVLSDDQLRDLFATCKGKTFLERRDFAMLAFLADTGVRVGELVALDVDDVDSRRRPNLPTTPAVLGGPRRGDPWEADHVAAGDPDSPLLPAHRSCNRRRGAQR